METSVKHRIKQFIEHKGISVREFERVCGLSNGYVNGIIQTIMPNKLSDIILQFPELNASWVLTGDGTMLKRNKGVVESPTEEYSERKDDTDKLLSIIASQQRTIEVLTDMLYNERKNK